MKNNPAWRTILWIALPLYFLATFYLLALGEWTGVLLRLAYTAYTALLVWLTIRVTRPQPVEAAPQPSGKTRVWAQLVMLAAVILLTGISALNIPLWSALVDGAYRLGEALLPVEWFGGPGNALANPLQYFVIPIILLLILGARPGELGLGRGYRILQSSLVWLALPLLIWTGLMATGSLAPQALARRLIGNTFQNGFFEEFLFRGALFTRLRQVMASPVAMLVQALLFGLWHLRANTQSMDGNLLAGLAVCVISQAVTGLMYGIVFQRTRNLIVPSVAHVAMNALSQTFG
ncbi:MAG: CPBP family intramembrane metalloprotease [Anaerolineae bacterium]|nr:CPBP family intramembrane metalloprotease [Anaerolineae bacterium]